MIEEFPIPRPFSGEAVVQVGLCTLCGSDLHTITGARLEPTPTVLGHEVLGTIQMLGDPPPTDALGKTLEIGDRVSWSVCISCGSCPRCDQGIPQKCLEVTKYGHVVAEGRTALSGGLAEYMLIRHGSAIVKLPDSLPDPVACPANCAGATIASAFRTVGEVTGRRVLVFGAGMLGLTACAMANQRGASRVCVVESLPSRAAVAFGFGASGPPETNDLFDIVLECSGSSQAVEQAFKKVDVGGTVVLLGSVFDGRGVSFDPQMLVRKCATVRGVHNYAPIDLVAAVEFLQNSSSRFPFEDLIEASYPLKDINWRG